MPKKASPRAQARFTRAPLAAAILLMTPALPVLSQEIEEVLVTAQKRTENMQDVPISIQSFDTKTLEDLNVNSFDDYTKMLPSVASTPALAGVGFTNVYFRGVATGGDGQAIGAQPSVGMYLDEMPITTVQGNLDIHMYDVARVEALAGPQGTLYGASSQAGTIRIITNKPDPSGFSASYSLEANQVDGDDMGYTGEGYVNLPISDSAALRLVGWKRRDAGWIDNVLRSRTYPGDQSTVSDDITVANARFVDDNYNTIDTEGARAALRVDLSEDWTTTVSMITQRQEAEGAFGEDLSGFGGESGDRQVSHIQEEFVDDRFYQLGLTVEGKIGMFDVVYSGAHLNRNLNSSFDYSDYSYFYDVYYTSGYFASLWVDNNGDRIFPGHYYGNNDNYDRDTHELRISTPQDKRVRGMIGFFKLNSTHNFEQKWKVDGLADSREPNFNDPDGVKGFSDIVYLNNMDREDRDEAVFGQIAFDITDALELTLGGRWFKPTTDVTGFFGFGLGLSRDHEPGTGKDGIRGTPDDVKEIGEPGDPLNGGEGAFDPNGPAWGTNGEWRCPSQRDYDDTPCQNVDARVDDDDSVYRVNLSYQISDDHMVYATWSEGYRPGGVNRNPFEGNYEPDFLTNWELGWKTQWLDNSLQFNGAVFYEEWESFQVGFQGSNGINQFANGPEAYITGTEMQVLWLPTENLTIASSWAIYDTEIDGNYCGRVQQINGVPVPITECPDNPKAPDGTKLPVTPDFKGNIVARYTFPLWSYEGHVQASVAYQGKRSTLLDVAENSIVGDMPSNTFVDFSAGLTKESYAIELFIKNLTDEDVPLYVTTQCQPGICEQVYGVTGKPRTIGLKFSQFF